MYHAGLLLDFFDGIGKIDNVQGTTRERTADTMTERRTLETILLDNKLVSTEQLGQITRYANAVGIDLYEAVLQKKIAPSDDVMMAYAESIGLPFIHLTDVSIDDALTVQIDPITARQYSFMPISIDQGHVLLATTKPIIPDVEAELRMIFNLPVRCAICTPAELNDAITEYFPRGSSRIIKTERENIPLPKPVAEESEPVEPMSDEEKKNRLMMSFVALNFTVAFVCFVLYSLHIPKSIHNTWYQFLLLALLGMIIGGVVAHVVWKKLSRS